MKTNNSRKKIGKKAKENLKGKVKKERKKFGMRKKGKYERKKK